MLPFSTLPSKERTMGIVPRAGFGEMLDGSDGGV